MLLLGFSNAVFRRKSLEETKAKQSKAKQSKPNQTKPNQTKPNQIKPNETKPNQTKRNQTNHLVQFIMSHLNMREFNQLRNTTNLFKTSGETIPFLTGRTGIALFAALLPKLPVSTDVSVCELAALGLAGVLCIG